MSTQIEIQPSSDRELAICLILDAPPEKIFQGWTQPELMKQWFCPAPWSIAHAETDVRPGGSSFIVMKSPEGQEFPNRGVYLEVIPNRKLVFTDAFTRAWEPSAKPFFVGELTFEDLGNGKTKYTARARHWTAEDAKQHEQMGFSKGWTQCAEQLEALLKKL